MPPPIHPGSIVILDCGGQYAHLIGNRVRRLGAYSEVRVAETPASALRGAAGIILSGGPQSVYEEGSPQADPAILELGIPVLGLCYGHQWLAQTLGGTVTPGAIKEYGRTEIRPTGKSLLLDGLPAFFTVWMSHGDEVSELPPGFTQTAASATCRNAAMEDPARNIFGLQFHVEVTHTEHGMEILKRFVGLCDHAPWSIDSFSSHVGAEIKRDAEGKKVFMLVSGGVDSTVAFVLLNTVLGENRVQGLMIDTGLMRKNEIALLQESFARLGIKNLSIHDASDQFFSALNGIADPEEKRKKIGNAFLDVQRQQSEKMNLKLEDGWMLGQGTIYPDTIETGGTKHADHIKTHHNRVPAVQKMIEEGLVIEPLKELYKDEVRQLGEELGLPRELVWRQPFPGPGLGVRILCTAISDKRLAVSTKEISVPHTVLPVKSVGVQGDGRTYRHAVALFSRHPCVVTPEHRRLATDVPNQIREINRVLLCTSHSSPVEFHLTPGFVTRERADLLREADAIVAEEMGRHGLMESIWQFPVVLLPFGTQKGKQSIVLRPISSTDAMTADAVSIPEDVLTHITGRILQLGDIDAVFLDLTNKPPGTIEWE